VDIDEGTARRIRKWWQMLRFFLESLLLTIEAKNNKYFKRPVKLKEIVRAVVNTHNWPYTRSAFVPG
jgi:hypothetical protein